MVAYYILIALCIFTIIYAYFYSNNETRIVIHRKNEKQKFTIDCFSHGLLKQSSIITSNDLEAKFREWQNESVVLEEKELDFISGKPIAKKRGRKKKES